MRPVRACVDAGAQQLPPAPGGSTGCRAAGGVVWLTVRRFFCDRDDCSTCTFVEQVSGLTERHAQRSAGLQDALVAIALALAGRAGSRLATALGMPVSRSTLLRRIRSLPDPPVGPVAVLGVDEFAVRHEALLFRMEVEDLGRPVVAAMG